MTTSFDNTKRTCTIPIDESYEALLMAYAKFKSDIHSVAISPDVLRNIQEANNLVAGWKIEMGNDAL